MFDVKLTYFDGQRKEVDLLEGSDLLVLDEASQLGDGNPLVLLLATAAASTATTAATASTASSAAATTVAKSTTETSTIAGWC